MITQFIFFLLMIIFNKEYFLDSNYKIYLLQILKDSLLYVQNKN